MEERYDIKVNEHKKVACKTDSENKLSQRWERVRGEVVRGVEEECRRFKESILEVGEEVCGTRKIRERKKNKESE